MVTRELVQSLCRNRSWGGGRGSAPTNPSSSCSQCTPRRGAEAAPPPPPAPLAGFTLRPKCDTSSLRWEGMSSVQWNTLGANKYVSALRHNRRVLEVHATEAAQLIKPKLFKATSSMYLKPLKRAIVCYRNIFS